MEPITNPFLQQEWTSGQTLKFGVEEKCKFVTSHSECLLSNFIHMHVKMHSCVLYSQSQHKNENWLRWCHWFLDQNKKSLTVPLTLFNLSVTLDDFTHQCRISRVKGLTTPSFTWKSLNFLSCIVLLSWVKSFAGGFHKNDIEYQFLYSITPTGGNMYLNYLNCFNEDNQ